MSDCIKKVEAGSMDKLQKLLGTFDENLNIIMRGLGVIIRVEGLTFIIEGSEERAAQAAAVLESLSVLVSGGDTPDKGRVEYCVELAREGKAQDITKLSSDTVAITYRGKPVKCKTVGQKKYIDSIKINPVTFGIGPAGTGKTYLAVCVAVQAMKSRQADKIILTRPAVEAGEKLGFLPGDLQNKVDPYLRPLYDALQEMLGLETYTKLMERGSIEIAPLAYMRGRTLSNAFIILDEAQNTTREQMKMFLTRLGDGSKMVITGDATQIDLPSGKSSGLDHAAEVLKDVEGVGIIHLTDKDVVRNPMVMKIVRAYDKADKDDEKRRLSGADGNKTE
ncbi:MAG TPA: phosphate starvation-inducible protein PhoH [Clostridiales bacterium]|nr:phosphate starvation-inducible protein PhoH [Clostridiales bacterium]